MPFTVLLVCTGNTCRSAMAEGILRKMLGGDPPAPVRVLSAGTAGFCGMPASQHAQDVSLAHGVDIGRHVSRSLTPELIEGSDVILAMTRAHLERVIALAPQAADRTHLLSAFADGSEVDVPDPMGGPREDYERAYDMVAQYLSEAAPSIVKLAGEEK